MNEEKQRGKSRLIFTRICGSKKFNRLPGSDSRLLYLLLYLHTDDFGRFEAEPLSIKRNVVPGFDWSLLHVGKLLIEIARVGLIEIYVAKGEIYGVVVAFNDFQRFKRGKVAQFPPPQDIVPNEQLAALFFPDYSTDQLQFGLKDKGSEGKRSEEAPPGPPREPGMPAPPVSAGKNEEVVFGFWLHMVETGQFTTEQFESMKRMPRLMGYQSDFEAVAAVLRYCQTRKKQWPQIFAWVNKMLESYGVLAVAGALARLFEEVDAGKAPKDFWPYAENLCGQSDVTEAEAQRQAAALKAGMSSVGSVVKKIINNSQEVK